MTNSYAGSFRISTGKITWTIAAAGQLEFDPLTLREWLDHQHSFATSTIADLFGALINKDSTDEHIDTDSPDTCERTKEALYEGTWVTITISIKGARQVPFAKRETIVKLFLEALRDHALMHLKPISPQEEFARYLDPVPDQQVATPSSRGSMQLPQSTRWPD